MNTTYTLTEGNDALNRALLMMRYDLGKTLNENVISEQPDEKFDTPYNKELMRKYNLPSKTMTLDEFMEDFREALSHPAMIGLEVFLLSTGVGVGAVVASYVALLAYDVYKGVTTGNWDWLNIIFEVLAIVSSGVLNKPLIPILRAAKGLSLNTLDKVLKFLSKTKIWPKIESFLNSSIDILKSFSKNINKFFKWLSQKTGFKFIEGIPSKVQGVLNSIINKILNFLKLIGKGLKSIAKGLVEPFSKVGTKQAVRRAVGYATFSYLFQNKVLPFIKKLSDEEKIIKRGESSGVDEMMDNLQKNNKNYFPKKIDNIVFITNPDETLNRMTINNEDYIITSEINYKVKKI